MKTSKEEKAHAKEMLLRYLQPDSTVYTVLRHVSQSGMQRRIDLFSIGQHEGKPYMQYLSGYAAALMEGRLSKKQGIVVNGCGMDMGFHLVSNLSYYLFGKEGQLRHSWI